MNVKKKEKKGKMRERKKEKIGGKILDDVCLKSEELSG